MGILKNGNFLLILGIVIMAVMGGSIIGPVLPAMAEPLGVAKDSIGWVMSVYTFFALVFTPFLGALADRAGRKKVLVPATMAFGVAGGLIAFSSTFQMILVLRAVQGISVAAMMNLGVTLIGDLFEGRDRARAMGLRTSAQNIINVFAPPLAGTLAVFAWHYPFLIYLLALPLALVVALKLHIVELRTNGGLRKYLASSMVIIKNPVTVWTFISNLFLFILLFVIVIYMPVLVTDGFGLTTAHAGFVFSIGAGVSAIIAGFSGKLSKKRTQSVVSFGFFLCGLALFCISQSDGIFSLLPCMILWGSGFGLTLPAITNTAASQAPTELRAGVMSIFSMMIFLGQTISPPAFGVILGITNIHYVFTSASFVAVIPVVYSLIMHIKN